MDYFVEVSFLAGWSTINHANPQAVYGPRAVVDLVHAGMHLVRNSGGPASVPPTIVTGGLMGKAKHYTPIMAGRKSDKFIVPKKQPNKTGSLMASRPRAG